MMNKVTADERESLENAHEYLLALHDTPTGREETTRLVRRTLTGALGDRFSLTVIDVARNPDALEEHGLMAAPALIRTRPTPRIAVVGDLQDVVSWTRRMGLSVGE